MPNKKLLVLALGLFIATSWMVADAMGRGVYLGWDWFEWALVMGLPLCSALLIWVACLGDPDAHTDRFYRRIEELQAEREHQEAVAYLERCFDQNTIK